MKKDIVWLKREIRKELESWQGVEGGIDEDGINEITLLINQLDEPEVTLDRAFEKVAESYFMKKEEIWRHLEWLEARGSKVTYKETEILSQKLPVIPKFVADWMKENQGYNIYGALSAVDKETHSQVHDWVFVKGGINDFTRAWLDGYTVEEEREQKYVIKISEHDYMVMDDEGFMYPTDINVHKYKSEFTEQEIKEYDERYWAFRKPVEELGK